MLSAYTSACFNSLGGSSGSVLLQMLVYPVCLDIMANTKNLSSCSRKRKEWASGYHPGRLKRITKSAGFPVLIKAIHGGGGKGMRTVMTPTLASFQEALSSAKRESLKAFGNDTVLVE